MKKLGLLVLCLCLSNLVSASTWLKVTSGLSVEGNSISKTHFWAKSQTNSTVNGEPISHMLVDYEYSCEDFTMRAMRRISYGTKGNVLADQIAEDNKPFERVVPETPGELVLQFVCKRNSK